MTGPTRLERVLGMHPLGIASLRRGLGAILLCDLAMRIGDLEAHYSDRGILPFAAAPEHLPSLYWLSGSPLWAGVLFALTAGAAAALIWGRHPRWASLAAWVLVVSLHNRNFAVYHSGDTLFRLALLWSALLPSKPGRQAITVATAGFTVQLALVFACSFDFKLRGHAWTGGYAVRDALSVMLYARPYAQWIAREPGLVKVLTWSVLAAQAVVPLSMLLPLRSPWPRLLAVAAVVSMQAGFGVFLRVGTFPFVVSLCALALSPPELFERFERFGRPQPDPVPGRRRRLDSVVAAAVLAVVLFWNLGEAGAMWISDEGDVPLQETALGRFARLLRLDQRWGMFAPNPQTQDGVFSLTATLADGSSREIIDDVTGSSGPEPSQLDHRWLLYFLDLQLRSTKAQLDALVRYACRVSQLKPGEVTLYFRHFERLPDGTRGPETVDTLANARCAGASL